MAKKRLVYFGDAVLDSKNACVTFFFFYFTRLIVLTSVLYLILVMIIEIFEIDCDDEVEFK